MEQLFKPKNIAVIGASQQKGKIGYSVIDNIKFSGYKGDVFPINPKGGDVCGYKIFKSVSDVPADIDVATIIIPAHLVFDAVKECAKKKTKIVSIITSGFSETGNVSEEKAIVDFALSHDMRILGPNIFGFFSATAPINATFGPQDISVGNVAIITQSGALGIAMIGKTKAENIGLSAIVSVGNKSDIDESDLMEYFLTDELTKVIFMYIEGIKNGERFIKTVQQVTRKKPVIVIKSGRSKRGAMAAASHTGSLAGADEIFSDVMKQCGVHRAESIQEALNWCKFLSQAPPPAGENTVIITNGGGVGVLAADACEKYHVNLYDNVDSMKTIFSGAIPDFGSCKNPIDITGQATMGDYEKSIINAFEYSEIHSIICLGCETSALTPLAFKTTLASIHEKWKNKKPIVYSFVGGQGIEDGIAELRRNGIPIFSDIYESISCLGQLFDGYRKSKEDTIHSEDTAKGAINFSKIQELIQSARLDNRKFLLAHESKAVMEAAGIAMPKSIIAKSIKDAVIAAEEITYPVAMKVVSQDIIHKSDAGAVALELGNKEEVIDAYEVILHNCRKYNPQAKIKGIEVQEMVKKGTETIIGARRDAVFGPIIMFGLGGIYVEVMKDVAFRSLPLNKGEILGMLKDIRSYPLLLGVRGEEKKDIDGITDVILKTGTILETCKDISDIEINPLIAYDEGDGVKALDARILLS